MLKKKVLLSVSLVISLFVVSACGSGQSTGGDAPKFVSIGTAKQGSSLYSYGTGFADLLTKNLDGSQFDALETGGTIENMNLIHEGELEMAVGAADTYYDARHGEGPFQEKKKVMLGWKLKKSTPQIVTLKKSGIEKIEDLKGKRFSIGASGSAANVTGITILRLHGVDSSAVTFSYLGWGPAMEALADGAIDAALVLGSIPSAAVQKVGVMQPISFVNVDPQKMKASPIFDTRTVEPGTYKGQDEEGVLPSVDQFVFLSPDLPEDVVYEITKLGMENTEALGQAHPVGKAAEPITEEQLKFMNGEIHPGALKYYKERGWR